MTSTSGSDHRLSEGCRRKSLASKALSKLASQLSEVESVLKAASQTQDREAQSECVDLMLALEGQSKKLAIERWLQQLSPKQFEAYEAWVSREYALVACCGSNRSGKSAGGS